MFKKWWVILIQGILLLILGIFIFENPVEALAGASIWFGLLIIVTGTAGIFGWLADGRENSESPTLIWSILSVLFGFFVLLNLLAAMKEVTIIYGLWVLITGFHLLHSGWSIKTDNIIGWILVLAGLFSIVFGLMMLFNINNGAEGFATIFGIQVLLTGIALILLAVAKKMMVEKVKAKIRSITQRA